MKNKKIISLLMIATITSSFISNLGTISVNAASDSTIKVLGNVKKVLQKDDTIEIKLDNEKVKITFYTPDVFRVWMDPEGDFDDPTSGKILYKKEPQYDEDYDINLSKTDEGDYYKISSGEVVLRIYKSPYRLALYKNDNETVVWEETSPLEYGNGKTKQSISTKKDEQFYGGGVQNGYFSHKNKKIDIAVKASHWNDGAVSNPVPFYMSSEGYGVVRNTFKPGQYDFKEKATLTHNEDRFDAVYFAGDNFEEVMDSYTELTGRPQLIPRWGLGMGDANCYNRTNPGQTPQDADKILNGYVENDMPRGWFLPNDGYGCGYTNLKDFIKKAEGLGFKVGLWTENSVDKIAQEVGEYGSRLVKTDVAWVGPGYEFALDGVKMAHEGIEGNSDSRGYVWTVCGWAGTQRYAAPWTGDQSGDWEYIRMHIPTYIGSGMSGMPIIGSDVDGIFGGSKDTQVRDIQWKSFTPIMLNMSGWGVNASETGLPEKQPWVWGEPATSINRMYLKLKSRMTPYMYTYLAEANRIGTPIVRGMVWEYSDDPFTWGTETQYQYMLGENMLVAPVYEDTEVRNGIYLPDENQTWIDYFTGEQYTGGKVINNFEAPLWKLPLFIKDGAIIPMYPNSNHDGEVIADSENPITFDVYPSGKTSFELYEDDGNTREHREGAFANTLIESDAPTSGTGKAIIKVNATEGTYENIQESRKNEFSIHTKVDPGSIKLTIDGKTPIEIAQVDSKELYDSATTPVWFFEQDSPVGGVLHVKTDAMSIRTGFQVEIENFNNDAIPKTPEHDEVPETPTGLQANEVSDSKISIQWNESANTTSYDLMVDDMLYENIKSPFKHEGLNFLSTHTYKVRAVNSAGASEWSEELTVTTLENLLKDVVSPEEMSAIATSSQPGETPDKAIDGDIGTLWHTKWGENGIPATFDISFKNAYNLNKFEYLSRPKGSNGNIKKYNLYISQDGINYKKLVNEGIWPDQNDPHMVEFKENMVVKHIRVEALQGNGNFAAALEFRPYKVEGTNKVILGDYTGDGQVTDNDIVFVNNYMGATEKDNDWGYVSKCDINYNGVIDSYDLAFVSSQVGEKLQPSGKEVKGNIALEFDKEQVKAGEEFTVSVLGKGISDMYAFDTLLDINTDKFEIVNSSVPVNSSNLTSSMVNASAYKEHEGDDTVVVSFVGKGNMVPINEEGLLATFKLRAKVDTKTFMEASDARIVGTNLHIIEALTDCNGGETPELIPVEREIPKSQMTATATTEHDSEPAGLAIDGNYGTWWHTPWFETVEMPQNLSIDLGGNYDVSKIKVTPRAKGANGVITEYKIYAIKDGIEAVISEGTWADDGEPKLIELETPVNADKIKVEALKGNGGFAAIAEVDIIESIPGTIKVEGVKLDKTTAEIALGSKLTLNATITPEDATNKGVIWSSSNKSVAKVCNGNVEGIKEGTAIITATTVEGEKVATCEVTVKNEITNPDLVLSNVNATVDKNSLKVGENTKIKLSGKMNDGSDADLSGAVVRYGTSNPLVATIDEEGNINALTKGTTDVVATVNLNGVEVQSNVISIKVIEDGEIPDEGIKPKKVTSLKAIETTSNSIKVSWNAPTNTPIEEYMVYKDGELVGTVKNEETDIEGLKSNTLYGIKIVAKGVNGEKSRPVSINIRTKKQTIKTFGDVISSIINNILN
ncbi:discoidin domain-containing protein, partial [Clostridium tarantellae]